MQVPLSIIRDLLDNPKLKIDTFPDLNVKNWFETLTEGSAIIFTETKAPIRITLKICLWIGESNITVMMNRDEIKSYQSIISMLSD